MDELDIFLFFPLAFLLQMSMVFTALFLCFGKAPDRLYTSLIDLTLLFTLCAESRCTLLCSFHLFLCLILFLLYWAHCFANMFFCGPMIVCNALMFWPRFYNNLFGAQSTGCSFLTILFDPQGGGLSNWPYLRNAIYPKQIAYAQFGQNSMFFLLTSFMGRMLTFINLLVMICLWQ
jgi:hypothetical protein